MGFFSVLFAMSLCASVCVCFLITCWEGADLLALVWCFWLWVGRFPVGVLGRVWCSVVFIPNICTLTYFEYFYNKSHIHELLKHRVPKQVLLIFINCKLGSTPPHQTEGKSPCKLYKIFF